MTILLSCEQFSSIYCLSLALEIASDGLTELSALVENNSEGCSHIWAAPLFFQITSNDLSENLRQSANGPPTESASANRFPLDYHIDSESTPTGHGKPVQLHQSPASFRQ